jgi:surface antigen
LVLIASVASVGYQSPVKQQLSSQNVTSTQAQEVEAPSVDQLVAADLAAATAQSADLSVASNVSNLSISLNAKSQLAQTDDNVISKPQIVEVTQGRGISTYVTVKGDTVPKVAAKFGVSSQTVRWANDLASDSLSAGQHLRVPNTDGVIYTVQSGDTLSSIAGKFKADKARIISYNDLEVSGIKQGLRLVIPGGIQVAQTTAPATGFSGAAVVDYGGNAAVVGNRYDFGYCTWYVYNKRAAIGKPVGSFWGNAASWAYYAAASGYKVDHNPSVGAVLQVGGGFSGGLGHVAFVERVNSDGSVFVSEMNYAGWDVVSTRTIPAGQAASYNYIH